LDQNPENNILNYHMGMVLKKQGKQKETIIFLKKALALNEDFSGADIAQKLIDQSLIKK